LEENNKKPAPGNSPTPVIFTLYASHSLLDVGPLIVEIGHIGHHNTAGDI
jgi:hypothetical protein